MPQSNHGVVECVVCGAEFTPHTHEDDEMCRQCSKTQKKRKVTKRKGHRIKKMYDMKNTDVQ